MFGVEVWRTLTLLPAHLAQIIPKGSIQPARPWVVWSAMIVNIVPFARVREFVS